MTHLLCASCFFPNALYNTCLPAQGVQGNPARKEGYLHNRGRHHPYRRNLTYGVPLWGTGGQLHVRATFRIGPVRCYCYFVLLYFKLLLVANTIILRNFRAWRERRVLVISVRVVARVIYQLMQAKRQQEIFRTRTLLLSGTSTLEKYKGAQHAHTEVLSIALFADIVCIHVTAHCRHYHAFRWSCLNRPPPPPALPTGSYVPSKVDLGAAAKTKRPTSCVLVTPPKETKDKPWDPSTKTLYGELKEVCIQEMSQVPT